MRHHHSNDDDGSFYATDTEYYADGEQFAEPGGRSALRASGKKNPRNLPCPTCKLPNLLTPADRACGYQCDRCADAAEGCGP